MKNPLVERTKKTDRTRLKYKAARFDWGKSDCIHMARSHLVQFDHALPQIPRYNGPISGLRALKKKGHDGLEGLFDELLPRIPPAAMITGDIALMEADDGPLDAIVISVGEYVMGWHEDADAPVMIIPRKIKAAWSVKT